MSFPRIPTLLIHRQSRTIGNSRRTDRNVTIIRRNRQEECIESNIPVPCKYSSIFTICRSNIRSKRGLSRIGIDPELNKTAISTPLDMKNTTLSNGVNRATISCFAIRSPQDALRQKQWGPFKSRLTAPVDTDEYHQSTSYPNRRLTDYSCRQGQ